MLVNYVKISFLATKGEWWYMRRTLKRIVITGVVVFMGLVTTLSSLGTIGLVGDDFFEIYYIKFYQSLNGIRTRERQRWNSEPDYNEKYYVKEITLTVDSVRFGY